MWKITLADGSTINNLTLNGNNFVSKSEITPAMFTGKLNRVNIECDDENITDWSLIGTHEHMRLVAIQHYEDGWYFVLQDIPADELRLMTIEGNIEYVAMMAEVAL